MYYGELCDGPQEIFRNMRFSEALSFNFEDTQEFLLRMKHIYIGVLLLFRVITYFFC